MLITENLKIGDKVIGLCEYDGNDLKGKMGEILIMTQASMVLFFYEEIESGHGGFNSTMTKKYREKLAKKYKVPINNCWNVAKDIAPQIIRPLNKNDIINLKLKKIAKI